MIGTGADFTAAGAWLIPYAPEVTVCRRTPHVMLAPRAGTIATSIVCTYACFGAPSSAEADSCRRTRGIPMLRSRVHRRGLVPFMHDYRRLNGNRQTQQNNLIRINNYAYTVVLYTPDFPTQIQVGLPSSRDSLRNAASTFESASAGLQMRC